MAGAKRKSETDSRIAKQPRVNVASSSGAIESSVSANESKQKSRKTSKGGTPTKSRGGRKQKITARIAEEDQVVEMEAEGQATEFLDDDKTDTEDSNNSSSESEGKLCRTRATRSQTHRRMIVVDSDIQFNLQTNNNASMLNTNNVITDETEEGECSQESGETVHPAPKQVAGESCEESVTEQLIQKRVQQLVQESIGHLQNYFEQKFEDMSRVAELEKQLEESKRHLERLKAKGIDRTDKEEGLMGQDQHSEITIYRNAIEKKRGSSSSEDDYIDTSGN